MKENTRARIHNRFDFVITDVDTGEVTKAKAENIVLDRMYGRLINFQTFFVNIVFGSGTGTLDATRTTLFTRIGSKAAINEQLIRSYPISVWTRYVRLGVDEFNGNTLREIGISDDATLINTHAMITDSEGNPITIEKTNLKVIDIYATLYVELYDVDSGLQFYSNGLRDYLTGGALPTGNVIGVALSTTDDMPTVKTGTRTVNVSEKSTTLSASFGIDDWNKDIRWVAWTSLGLRCKFPRTGVFEGMQRNDVPIGTADGVQSTFTIPNQEVSGIVMKVDGVQNNNWTKNALEQIVFDPIPATGAVTASYLCNLFPKTINYVFDISMTIKFAGTQPTPIEPAKDFSAMPGAQTPIAGDANYGYFGEVAANDFITGEALCAALGITAGTLINSTAGWLKVAKGGSRMMVSKMCIRHTISWNNLDSLGVVYGEKVIAIEGGLYTVRMLSTVEWNEIMYPLHQNYGQWTQLTDAQLGITNIYTWTSTISGTTRVVRGGASVEGSGTTAPTFAFSDAGFRPVLEFLLKSQGQRFEGFPIDQWLATPELNTKPLVFIEHQIRKLGDKVINILFAFYIFKRYFLSKKIKASRRIFVFRYNFFRKQREIKKNTVLTTSRWSFTGC